MDTRGAAQQADRIHTEKGGIFYEEHVPAPRTGLRSRAACGLRQQARRRHRRRRSIKRAEANRNKPSQSGDVTINVSGGYKKNQYFTALDAAGSLTIQAGTKGTGTLSVFAGNTDPGNNDKPGSNTDSPETGDNSSIVLWLSLLFVGGAPVVLRKEREHH